VNVGCITILEKFVEKFNDCKLKWQNCIYSYPTHNSLFLYVLR